MKRYFAAAFAAIFLSTAAFATPLSAPSDWAQDEVQRAISAELVPAALQTDWQSPITREAFCALSVALWTAQGVPLPPLAASNPFTDTSDENVRRMAAAGVVSGKGAGIFAPQSPITREEAAAMLYRLTQTRALPTSYADQRVPYPFADSAQISAWAQEAVSFCARNGVMNGTDAEHFSPQQPYTTEQSAITLLRLQRYAAAQAPTPLTMTAEGVPMLYSNNPEILDPRKFEGYGIYTAKTAMPVGTPIDAEYYHWSHMGSGKPMILGVAVTNSRNTVGVVEINRRGVGMGTDPITVSQQGYEQFFASDGEDAVRVSPGETKLVVRDELRGGTMINARVQLTAKADGLTMKLVALKEEVPSSFLAELPRGVDDSAGRTAGRFQFSERRAAVDAATVQNFTLCGNTRAQWKLNPGEYPQTHALTDPLAIRDTGTANFNFFLNGNFATIYHLDFQNAAGKTLLLRPNDPSVIATGGRYLLRTEQDGWKTVSATEDAPYQLPLSDSTSVDFLLLGGNYGNIGFRLV